MKVLWIGEFYNTLKRYFRKKITYLKENIKIHDIIFILLVIGVLVTILVTRLFYPFNRYTGYNNEAIALLVTNIPPFIFTLIFLMAFALIFTIWVKFSPNKIRFIIPFFGLVVSILGPFSQNIIYSTDSIYHVGILSRIFDLSTIPTIQLYQYTGLLFHRLLLPFSLLFNAVNTILYIAPIITFLLYIPLGDKLIKISENWRIKVLIGFCYYIFPFILPQKFSATPYSLLIALVAFLLFLAPYDTKKTKIVTVIISSICIFVHIHGLIVFVIFLLYIVTQLHKKSEKFKIILNFSIFGAIIVPYFILLIFQKSIGNFISTKLSNLNSYDVIKEIFWVLTKDGGYLSEFVIPKLQEGGIFAIWYLIQIIIFLATSGFGIHYLLVRSLKESPEKNEDNGISKRRNLHLTYGVIFTQFSVIILIGLFVGNILHLFRFQYFTLLIGLFPIIISLKNFINKIQKPVFSVFLFIFLTVSPLIIYNQYTPYQESEFELVDWVGVYNEESNVSVVVVTHQHLYKLIWALTNDSVISIQWPSDFWSQKLHESEIFDLRDQNGNTLIPYNLLIVFSSRIVAQEFQFNAVDITSRIGDISPYFTYTLHRFKDIYIYEFLIQ